LEKAFKLGEQPISSCTSFYGVFDGHGGPQCAKYICNAIPKHIRNSPSFGYADMEMAIVTSFKKSDKEFLEISKQTGIFDGSTACTATIRGSDLFVCNTGDSRAVLATGGKAVRLTKDHKPNDPKEKMRIHQLGGQVVACHLPFGGVMYRLNGVLAMSRAFGDAMLKGVGLTVKPDVFRRKITAADEFIIIASDGLYDVLSDTKAVNIVRKVLNSKPQSANRLDEVAKTLVMAALNSGTMDNTTVLIIIPPSSPFYRY